MKQPNIEDFTVQRYKNHEAFAKAQNKYINWIQQEISSIIRDSKNDGSYLIVDMHKLLRLKPDVYPN